MITDRKVKALIQTFLKKAVSCSNCPARHDCAFFKETTSYQRKRTRAILEKESRQTTWYAPMMNDTSPRAAAKRCVIHRVEKVLELCSIKEVLKID